MISCVCDFVCLFVCISVCTLKEKQLDTKVANVYSSLAVACSVAEVKRSRSHGYCVLPAWVLMSIRLFKFLNCCYFYFLCSYFYSINMMCACMHELILNACDMQILRFNDLLDLIRMQLTALERGIKGFVVMSSDLEEVFQCIYDARVPSSWQKVRVQIPELSSIISASQINGHISGGFVRTFLRLIYGPHVEI